MGTGGWSRERTAGKALTLPIAGHKSSFPWLPEQHGMLHSYNSCHPCMTSCGYLGHPTSYHSLASFASCIPPCPSAPIPPSPSFSILQSKVVMSLQHFSVLLLSYCWDMACNYDYERVQVLCLLYPTTPPSPFVNSTWPRRFPRKFS